MNQLLEFIDRLCIDERLYWRVPLKDDDRTLEVSWDRQARPHPWRLKAPDDAEWLEMSAGDLAAAFAHCGADQSAFERQLGASVLTQAVFADLVLEGAFDLFGEDVVKRSIRDTRAFLTAVSDTAARMTRAAEPDRKLRLVNNGGRTR